MHPCLINNSSGMPTYAPLTEDYLTVVNSLSFPYETTGEDMQMVIDVARTSRNLLYYDEDALAIILDEAQDMFAGNATPEETAKNIQARVSLYMLERYG